MDAETSTRTRPVQGSRPTREDAGVTRGAIQLDPADGAGLLAAIRAVPGATRLLDAVAETGAPAYLVGGAVRDLLTGTTPRELDVTVEDDVAELAAALGGDATHHERFGTATVPAREGEVSIDLARTRAETYASAGALPDVEPAPIDIDLHRRDATLNAIAIDLRTGVVRAAHPALEDLDAMVLRVLHPASFIDDPTRLWRLARYEVRLGADWDPATALLARHAIEGGALDTVSVERLASELRLALREPDPYGALAAAARLGLPPALDFDAERLDQAQRLGAGLADPADLALAALASSDPLLRRMLDRKHELAIIDGVLALRGAAPTPRPGPLAPDALGSQLRARFHGLPDAAIAAAPDADAAGRWLREVRSVRPAITGEDLLAAGVAAGPALGLGLAAVRDAVLDARIAADDRDAQLDLALQAAREPSPARTDP